MRDIDGGRLVRERYFGLFTTITKTYMLQVYDTHCGIFVVCVYC